MKLSKRWLREFVDLPVATEALTEKLTLSGLEVESVVPVAGAFSDVYVAEIRTLRPHPDAERLRIGDVDVGGGEVLQIVTAAANLREGMRVPLARIGATLASGKRIARARLRGVESAGMLCPAVELGIADLAEGVMELPADAPVGADVREYLGLEDVTLELNVTPNRGDCLSVLGVTREVGALFGSDVREPVADPVPPTCEDRFAIDVLAPADCPRYVGRVIRGINPAARTPVWMSERLRRSGLRGIHPIVDISNYVLLELGQPMHAFDLRSLSGGICVRRAQESESLVLLDGMSIRLSPETVVIADHRRAVALAGIMGGKDTAVGADSRDIFLESAFFAPGAIAGRAREYRLQTDSSFRFERGIDFTLQVKAVERATSLILAICGGRPGPVIEVVSSAHLPQRSPILLRAGRLKLVLGFAPEKQAVQDALGRLGIALRATAEGWQALPPPYRFDIALEVDLVEEVARVVGYERIPTRLPGGTMRMHQAAEGGTPALARIREVLVQRGYHEAITYSFVDATLNRRLRESAGAIALTNPISQDMAVMRTSLWPGLLRALLHNLSRQQARVRLFEIGRTFEEVDGNIHEINMLSGIVAGASWPEQWAARPRTVDFFDVKGDVEGVLTALAPRAALVARAAGSSALHPGQAAELLLDSVPVATVGALHPELHKDYDLRSQVFVFEIRLDTAFPAGRPHYLPRSKFPVVRRDLSIVVDSSLPAAALVDCVRTAAPEALRELQLFDVYEGEGIDSGKKSIALGLTFQGTSSTLIDEDIEKMVAVIVQRLADELGGTLRDS
ncbi:MAG: phenylalanine--tRNA ligase subunit beta [Chromatiales bacterium]